MNALKNMPLRPRGGWILVHPQGYWAGLSPGGGEILRKWKIPIKGFYFGLLRFITENYGVLLRILRFIYWPWTKTPKKPPKRSYLGKTWKNRADFFLQILRNITDITEIAITEYYGILRSVISHQIHQMIKNMQTCLNLSCHVLFIQNEFEVKSYKTGFIF